MAVTTAAAMARMRGRPGALAWALWALAMLGLVTSPWLDHLIRQAGRADLVQLNAEAVPYVLTLVSAATVGAVLASRRPAHPVGWLLLALGLSVVASGITEAYAYYGVLAPARGAPGRRVRGGVRRRQLHRLARPARRRPAGAGGPGSRRPRRWSTCWPRRSGRSPWTRPSSRSPARWRSRHWPARSRSSPSSPSSSPSSPCWSGAPPWWSGSAARTASSVSSSAGWRWRPACRRRRCCSSWSHGEQDRGPVHRGGPGLPGAAATGDRRGDPALPAVGRGPDHQPRARLRPAHRAERRRLCRHRSGPWPAAGP